MVLCLSIGICGVNTFLNSNRSVRLINQINLVLIANLVKMDMVIHYHIRLCNIATLSILHLWLWCCDLNNETIVYDISQIVLRPAFWKWAYHGRHVNEITQCTIFLGNDKLKWYSEVGHTFNCCVNVCADVSYSSLTVLKV